MNNKEIIDEFLDKNYPSLLEDEACMWFHHSDKDIYRKGLEDGIKLALKHTYIPISEPITEFYNLDESDKTKEMFVEDTAEYIIELKGRN